ncbi:BgTH12-03472 [Blumeria graminis f. sp. triticale]|uniref:trimethyllysine dioxygenase n=1 Tax=Blumeria graminis f. sp. triticale TaxID=1689686 RepID=A0A9W4CV66_BLUGR|nr:BgTH12-03472 [Blumeria graminis f. sp. triticale]
MHLQTLSRSTRRAPLSFPLLSESRAPIATNYHANNFTRCRISQEIDDWPLAGKHYEPGGRLTRTPDSSYENYNGNKMGIYGSWGISLSLKKHIHPIRLSNLWLRDNCRCQKCLSPQTMQRAFDTFSLPNEIVPDEVSTEKEGLRILWPASDGDRHVSFYTWDWITKNVSSFQSKQDSKSSLYSLWTSEIESDPPTVHHDEIMADDQGVGKWTAKIRKFGFCYVEKCPVSPEKTKRLIERISFIRETHYGGFYEFTSNLAIKDTAYTNLALPLHTDTTYFTDPAGLQMFHLLSHEHGQGGISVLVDGFKAAQMLKLQSPAEYKILTQQPVHAHTIGNEGCTIKPAKPFPVLNVADSADGVEPELYQIRWNNEDRGLVSLTKGNSEDVDLWYSAARNFHSLINKISMQYRVQLEPGRPLIFDNWRVLHGRTSFTGRRKMCGAYINHDDYISRWRNTNFTRDQIHDEIL